LVEPTNGKIVLQRQTAHADTVPGFPVPLSGLHRTAEAVWSTRLQTFLTVFNFHPISSILFNHTIVKTQKTLMLVLFPQNFFCSQTQF